MESRVKAYYTLTKPGIIKGNAVHVAAGAFFASIWMPNWLVIIGVISGTSLVIASACVINNFIDRDIDKKMARTRHRASVTGQVSVASAVIFAVVLLTLGMGLLVSLTNMYVAAIGAVAYVLYTFVYTLSKPRTIHSTLIGAIPGALPIMAGYVAVVGEVTITAWLLFLLVAAWQMPHFYAISLFRKKEYEAATIPVLGVVKPFRTVRSYILAYQVVYVVVISALIYTQSVTPASGLLLLGAAALWLGVSIRSVKNEISWARSVFGVSLIISLVLLMASVLHMFLVG